MGKCRRDHRERESAMANLKVKKYLSKPAEVEAIRVTNQNMVDVARWCRGEVQKTDEENGKSRRFVKVKVWRAQSKKLSEAFAGDWVIRRGTGWKVYTDAAFKNNYTDREAIPMAEDNPTMEAALFNGLVQELSTPKTTTVQVGSHIETIRTPAKGVPMRDSAEGPPIGVPVSGPAYGFPQGSIAMFGPPLANRAVIQPTGFERPISE